MVTYTDTQWIQGQRLSIFIRFFSSTVYRYSAHITQLSSAARVQPMSVGLLSDIQTTRALCTPLSSAYSLILEVQTLGNLCHCQTPKSSPGSRAFFDLYPYARNLWHLLFQNLVITSWHSVSQNTRNSNIFIRCFRMKFALFKVLPRTYFVMSDPT